MTGVLLFAGATAGVVAGGALSARLLRLADPLDRLLATALFACAQIVVLSIVVGAVLERYEAWTLVAGVALWDAGLVLALRRAGPAELRITDVGRAARSTFASLALWQHVVVAIAALALLWRLVLAALLPPFAYDGLTYHLTAVASWVQTGTIGPNEYALCCARYPANAEVLFAWPTVLLGRDTLTDTVQIVLALVGALATGGLGRAAGLSAAGATTAGALFLATPVVLAQANTNYNDVAVLAMLLVALYFVTRLAAARAGAATGGSAGAFALLAGTAAGLALGTKTTGVVFAAVTGALVLGLLAVPSAGLPRADAARAAGAFAAAALLVGGWWYGKNWVETGNPVAPFEVSVGGLELFAGTESIDDYLTVPPDGDRLWLLQVARSWYHDLVFWNRGGYSYEERNGGLGPLWSWLGWAAVAAAASVALRRRRDLVVTVLVPVALVFALLPYRWWSRFTLYLAALGAIAIVAVIERLRPSPARIALVGATVALAGGGAALTTWRVDPAGFGRTLTAADVVDIALAPSRPRTLGSLFFSEYRWLDDVPERATVAVELDAPSIRFPYPFFGARLERRVLTFSGGEAATLGKRLQPEPRPLYLVVEAGGAADRWARARPAALRPVFSERGISAFRRTAGILAP